jgi:hypothetical protein
MFTSGQFEVYILYKRSLPHGGRLDAGYRRFGESILAASGRGLCCLGVWDCAQFLLRARDVQFPPFWTQRQRLHKFSVRVLGAFEASGALAL